MTTVLGFVTPDEYDSRLGPGGTLRLMACLARHLPDKRVILMDGDHFLEVRGDESVHPKVFSEKEDPEDDFVPTVRRLGFVGFPSDSAPSMMPELIVPCIDGAADLQALRSEPLFEAAGILTMGNLDDAWVFLGPEGFLGDGKPSEDLRLDAENLVQCAGALGLVMRFG